MAAGFGDSNDIKITVSLETKDAIAAVEELQKSIQKTLGEYKSQLQDIAKASKQISAARIAEARAQTAAEVALIRERNQVALAQIKQETQASAEKTKLALAEIKTRQAAEAAAARERLASIRQEGENYRSNVSKQIVIAQTAAKEKSDIAKLEVANAQKVGQVEVIQAKTVAAEKIAQAKRVESERLAAEQSRIRSIERAAALELKAEQRRIAEIEKNAKREAQVRDEALKKAGQSSGQSLSDIFSKGTDFGSGKGLSGILNILTKLNPQLTSAASALFLVRGAFGAVTSVVGGTIGAIQRFKEGIDNTAKAANQIEGLRTGFDTLQRTIGQDSTRSIARLREATLGLISDTQLYQRANQAVLLGVPTDLFNEAAGAAVKLGRAMGIDAATGLESLSLGLGRQSRLYLDNLGIIVSAEEAYRNFAQANGIVGRELDDNEKRLAFFEEALRKIKERAEQLPTPINSVGISFQQYQVALENITQKSLEAFNQSAELADAYSGLAKTIESGTEANQAFALATAKLGSYIIPLKGYFVSATNVAKEFFATIVGTTEPQILSGFISDLEESLSKAPELRSKLDELNSAASLLQSSGIGGLERIGGLIRARAASIEDELAKTPAQIAESRARLAEYIDVVVKKESELNKAYQESTAASTRYAEKLQLLDSSQVKLIGSLTILRDKSSASALAIKEQADATSQAIESQGAALEKKVADLKSRIDFFEKNPFAFYTDSAAEKDKQALAAAEEALKFFVDYVDGARAEASQPIKITVDLTGLEEAQARLPELINQLTKQELESQGAIEVPGVSIGDLEPSLQKIAELKKQVELGAISVEEYGAKFKGAFTEIGNAISSSNFEKLKNDYEKAQAALTANANAGVEDFQKLEQAQQAYNKALKDGGGIQKDQAAQVEKLLKKTVQTGKDAAKEAKSKNNRDLKDTANNLKRQQAEFEKFARGVSRTLGTAIPKDIQKRLVDLFNSGKRGSKEFEAKLIELGREMQARGEDIGALQKEIADLDEFVKNNPLTPIVDKAETSKAIAELENRLESSGIFNLKKLFGGQTTGGFFGFDIPGFKIENEEALAGQVTDSLNSIFQAGADGFSASEDAPAIGAAIGAIIGAAFGGAFGAQIGSAFGTAFGMLIAGDYDEDAKRVAEYFGDVFGASGLGFVIQRQVTEGITQGVNGAIEETRPVFEQLSGLEFFNRGQGLGQFLSGAADVIQNLSQETISYFQAAGAAFASLLEVPGKQASIYLSLLSTLQGDLQNLQVLIQATGESLETFEDQIVQAFLNGALTIDEAYQSLVKIQELYRQGIPGAVGAVDQAISNLNNSLQSNAPGRYATDSLRDIAVEAEEAGRTFDSVIQQLGQTFGFSAEQTQLLFQAFKAAGITSLEELRKASDAQLLTFLTNLNRIKDETNEFVTTPALQTDTNTTTPRTTTRRGESAADRKKREAAELLKQQKDDAYQLTLASQKYADIIAKIAKGQLTELQGQKQILALRNKIFELVKEQQKLEAAYQKELAKGADANLQRLESLDEKRRSINKSLEDATKAADKNAQAFKELDLKAVIPFIKDMNNLGVVARQTGVNLETNVDILIKGFLQGRLSIKQVNDEIKKTKDLLGPGIPKAVGDVSQAFKNLIDAGTQGGAFSLDAFSDIFAEFREKFQKEGSALREAERQQLVANVEAAKAAFDSAIGPDATKQAKASLDVAKKALEDFYALQPKPNLDDLRAELEKNFGKDQVDVFFQALGESGLKTFDDFEKAGADSVVAILGRLQELGFKFGQTSDDVKKINEKLREEEKKANNGLDPLQQAIELVKQFNSGAAKLPPAFNDTGKAIDKLAGPLAKLGKGFDNIIEKLGKIGGNTFENDVVFNIRTVGDSNSQALIELLYGKGVGVGGDAGGNGPNQNQLNASLRRKINELERLKRAGQGSSAAANKIREDIRRLRQRGAQ